MYGHIIQRYVEIECITEELKDENNLEWTRRMNSIRNRVRIALLFKASMLMRILI